MRSVNAGLGDRCRNRADRTRISRGVMLRAGSWRVPEARRELRHVTGSWLLTARDRATDLPGLHSAGPKSAPRGLRGYLCPSRPLRRLRRGRSAERGSGQPGTASPRGPRVAARRRRGWSGERWPGGGDCAGVRAGLVSRAHPAPWPTVVRRRQQPRGSRGGSGAVGRVSDSQR